MLYNAMLIVIILGIFGWKPVLGRLSIQHTAEYTIPADSYLYKNLDKLASRDSNCSCSHNPSTGCYEFTTIIYGSGTCSVTGFIQSLRQVKTPPSQEYFISQPTLAIPTTEINNVSTTETVGVSTTEITETVGVSTTETVDISTTEITETVGVSTTETVDISTTEMTETAVSSNHTAKKRQADRIGIIISVVVTIIALIAILGYFSAGCIKNKMQSGVYRFPKI